MAEVLLTCTSGSRPAIIPMAMPEHIESGSTPIGISIVYHTYFHNIKN
jgi:hypothetical protein